MKVKANGLEIDYSLDGPETAPVVMFSHSLATDSGMWSPQIEALSGKYRLLRYDTRGHGGTGAPQGPYDMELLAEDAGALLDVLAIERVHWVGISMGGMIGQTLALRAPERFLSLSLCDTQSSYPPEAAVMWQERIDMARNGGMESIVKPTIERWFSAGFVEADPDAVDSIRAMIRGTPVEGFVGCCRAIAALNLTDQISVVDIPTLVVVGEDDQSTPVSASRTINDRIAGSRLVILPVARHLSNIEAADEFNAELSRFLAEHS